MEEKAMIRCYRYFQKMAAPMFFMQTALPYCSEDLKLKIFNLKK